MKIKVSVALNCVRVTACLRGFTRKQKAWNCMTEHLYNNVLKNYFLNEKYWKCMASSNLLRLLFSGRRTNAKAKFSRARTDFLETIYISLYLGEDTAWWIPIKKPRYNSGDFKRRNAVAYLTPNLLFLMSETVKLQSY